MARKLSSKLVVCCILMLMGLMQELAYAQVVVIPRDGFPYCEPFTGSSFRPNTVTGGYRLQGLTKIFDQNPILTGESLRLTTNETNRAGYVFVDLPFSSKYGIKVSFEYLAYGGPTIEGADGFSFFMFDGEIKEPGPGVPASKEFRLGGIGGSLSYAPWRNNAKTDSLPGLRGAFLGIGFDARRNWSNEFEGRYGGFEGQNLIGYGVVPPTRNYYNSVSIRGPERIGDIMEGYQFISGKRTNNGLDDDDPAVSLPASDYLHPDISEAFLRFKIDHDTKALLCNQEGYRKVFINLKPAPNDRYTISLDMLVNSGGILRVENIFTDVPYPYTAPKDLKVGFAAATGSPHTNFHEIRNVTVEVSDIESISAPDPPNLNETVCLDEDLILPFEVNLPADNQFIQCIQLYEEDPGPPDNSSNVNGDPTLPNGDFNCGLSGVCADECHPDNFFKDIPGVGRFEVKLDQLTEGNFEDERDDATIEFVPADGFVGTHTIYYTVLDNYGVTSFPRTITVTVNPLPKIEDYGVKTGPTCDGQNDGFIENVILKDLVDGYTYRWEDQNGNIIPSSQYSIEEVKNGAYFEATVGVTGLNLGTYSLIVDNPASNKSCDDVFAFTITDERGTPVEVVVDDQEVCEGTPVVFTPELEDPTDANNPSFVWWKDNGKTQVISDGMTEGGVTYSISSAGELTITGLAQQAAPYEYFVEVKADPSQNLCETPAGQLKRVQVVVLPPLDIQFSKIDDLCREASGQIVVNATGGFPTKTYSLDGINFVSTNTFPNLLPGDYTVYVNAGAQCVGQEDFTILGPDDPLTISETGYTDPSCGVANGVIEFEVAGGTPDPTAGYNVLINGNPLSDFAHTINGTTYTVTGLAEAASYVLEVRDLHCNASINSSPLNAIPVPVFTVSNAQVCPGEPAILTVDDSGKSNATNLVYTWTHENGDPLLDAGGVTYTPNSSTGELTIEGLTEDQLSYKYALHVSGDDVCSPDPVIATVGITPAPKVEYPTITDVSCFDGSDGIIELSATDPTTAADYEYSIDGGGSYQNSSVFSSLSAGTYTVRVRSKVGAACYVDIEDLVVGQPDELVISTAQNDPTCGESNGDITVTFSGGVADYTIDLVVNSATVESLGSTGDPVTFSSLAPNAYTVVITDANSCSISEAVTLTNDPGFAFDLEPLTAEVCFGQVAEILPDFTTNGTPTIKWYKDSNGTEEVVSSATPDSDGVITTIGSDYKLSVTGLAEGTYTYYLSVSGDGYCPIPLYDATIEVFPELGGSAEATPEQCFGASDGTITVNATGGNGDYTFSLNGGAAQSNNVFENLAPGTYDIEIFSSNGCSYSVSAQVDGPTAPIAANTPAIIRSSCGLNNGIIEGLSISGGWGEYSVEWRKGSNTGPVVPGDETGAENLAPDTYFMMVTDGAGCLEEFPFEVEAQPGPDYAMTSNISECAGIPIEFTPINVVSGSSPSEVRWYKGLNQTNEITAGADPSNPNVVYTIDDTDWSNPKLSITGLPAGSYTYYFYVVCTGQEIPVEVELFPIPNVVLETDPETCFGAADGKIRVVSGGLSTQRYYIDSDPQAYTQAELEAMSFGPKVYNIRVEQDGVGCPVSFSAEVAGAPGPLAATPLLKDDPACGQDVGGIETEITGGWAPYTVELFKDGSILKTETVNASAYQADNLAPGEYSLTITDAEGCDISTAPLTLVYGPTQVKVEPVEICEADIAILTPTTNPPASGATFEWFTDVNFTNPIVSGTSNAAGHEFQIASNGTLSITGLTFTNSPYTYYVRAVGGDVCEGDKGEAEVRVFDKPVLSVADVSHVVCYGDTGTIVLSATGGSGTYEYSIDGSPYQSSPEFHLPVGTYTATVRSGGCEDTVTGIQIDGPSAPISTTPPVVSDPTCSQPNGVIQFQVSGGYGNYSIETIKDGASLGSQSVPSGAFEKTGLISGKYEFIITDQEGCIFPIATPVTLVDGLTPITANDQGICEGEVAEITPSSSQIGISPVFTWYKNSDKTGEITSGTEGGITYTIGSDGKLSVNGLSAQATPYVYYVGVSGAGVCEPPLKKVEVQVYSIPTLRVSNPSIVCDPTMTVDLTQFIEGFNPNLYDYQIDDPFGNAMQVDEIDEIRLSGSYTVKVSAKGANCWSSSDRIQVKIAEIKMIPEFNYQTDLGGGNILVNDVVQILETVDFLDTSVGNVSIWDWDFGDGNTSSAQNPQHIYNSKGTFTVTLTTTDVTGCVATYQRVIEVRDDYTIIIPNAFTPDGTKNQNFKPQFRGIASMEFYVFNTWGELIFETNSLETAGWDGTLNGKPVPNGNYVYKAIFGTRSGGKVEKAGVFILIR